MNTQTGTSTKTRRVTCPRTPAGDLQDCLLDPEFAIEYYKASGEADRMTNRLFSGRFAWFWRVWYGVRGL